MLKKIIAAMVILVALLLIFSNQISNLYVKRQSERLARNAIQEITAEQIENNNKNTAADDEAAMWDWDQVQALSVDQTFEQLQMRMRQAQANRQTTPASQAMSSTPVPATGAGASATAAEPSNDPPAPRGDTYTEDYIIGILRVPSIDLEIAVLRGILNDNLLLGTGTMRPDQVMGEGNYPLAGHFSAYDGVLFNRVIDIGEGAMMYLTDKSNIYAYRVYDNIVVPETEYQLIDDEVAEDAGSPVLSLMTCYYSGSSGKRVFVQGSLVSVTPYSWEAFSALN